jgi:hypothetical protein
MATIIPCNGRLGVSYTYGNGDAETGPIGPDDWPVIGLLKRQGKISFTSQLVRERFEAASQSAMMKGCYSMLQGALRPGGPPALSLNFGRKTPPTIGAACPVGPK